MPSSEATLMITPLLRCRIERSTARQQRNTARRSVPSTKSQSASVVSRNGFSRITPALLTRMSIGPSASSVLLTRRSTPTAWLTSASTSIALEPAAAISPTSCRASPARPRWLTATRAPARANAIAIARPIPLAAPVTSAVLPSSPGISDSGEEGNSRRAEEPVGLAGGRRGVDFAVVVGKDAGDPVAVIAAHDLDHRDDLHALGREELPVQPRQIVPGRDRPFVMRVMVGEVQEQQVEPGMRDGHQVRIRVGLLVVAVANPVF